MASQKTSTLRTRWIDSWPVYYWRRYPVHLAANGFHPGRLAELPMDAVRQALELGYFRWTRAVGRWCRGRDVVDVGCGMGLHGIGFLLEGAKSYTGVDPDVKLRSPMVKNVPTGERVDCGWTPEALMARIKRLELVRGFSSDLEGKRSFDVAVLHNATEHLVDLPGVFASVHRLLRPGGRLIFSHHNWYAWNGHHQRPKTVDQILPGDPEQANYLDWAHLLGGHPPEAYVMRKLNRLSLRELRDLTARQFDIEVWKPTASTHHQGAGRLTDAIRRRHPDLGEADFMTQNVFVVARKMGG